MKSTRRIGLMLTLVFLLPALFFSVYELSTLDKDEKMIQDIYAKQLEAILFSVNQYADDIIGNWISRAETGFDTTLPKDSIPPKVQDVLDLNQALTGIFIIDTVDKVQAYPKFLSNESLSAVWSLTETSLVQGDTIIAQLLKYKRSGFQKIMRLDIGAPNTHCLVFISELRPKEYRLAGLYIDTELFIQDVVGPRLQSIARDQFILSVVSKAQDSTVYSTQGVNVTEGSAEALTSQFWNFPNYVLGIRTSGETLQKLVRERTRTNFMLLAALDVILILAVVLVFRNLKKEVDLAQNKTDFVSNVSHEIRTPLALISMFAETLEMNRAPSEEKKQEYYRIIHKESERLTGIVNKILNFSQTEAKKKVLTIQPLNMHMELGSILQTYDFHLRNKGFTYSLEGATDLMVKADREAFIESVINLIDNAVKYSEDTKRIEFTTGVDGNFGFLAVKDYGVGINRHDQKHIFDKFYRVPGGNLARTRGTGLGLSLAKQLMEEQHGEITVDSEPGKGTTFRLYFPRA